MREDRCAGLRFLRMLGAALILGTSAWVGFREASGLRRTEHTLRELDAALGLMECELSCAALTFLPLCNRLSEKSPGSVGAYFRLLSEAGEPLPGGSGRAVRRAGLRLPEAAERSLERLMDGFGAYDLDRQLGQLALARTELEAEADKIRGGLESGCRIRRLLGLCAGAALLILVI